MPVHPYRTTEGSGSPETETLVYDQGDENSMMSYDIGFLYDQEFVLWAEDI